ncbi:MAG: type II toxin-antitoxin system HicB family antitoxin [Candidatus Nitrosopolaris sp.]
MANFTVLWEQEEVGGYSGRCLEVPGAISEGETLEELKANMIDAITLVMKSINKEAREKQEQRMFIEVPVPV